VDAGSQQSEIQVIAALDRQFPDAFFDGGTAGGFSQFASKPKKPKERLDHNFADPYGPEDGTSGGSAWADKRQMNRKRAIADDSVTSIASRISCSRTSPTV
jgi:hypothetical protein